MRKSMSASYLIHLEPTPSSNFSGKGKCVPGIHVRGSAGKLRQLCALPTPITGSPTISKDCVYRGASGYSVSSA